MGHDDARAGAKAAPHINVTPLIDVLLVLLIIFMVLAPLRPTRFKALVPQPPPLSQHIDPNPLTLVVTIDQQSRLKLNDSNYLGTVGEPAPLVAELVSVLHKREAAGTPRQNVVSLAALPPSERIEKTVFIKAPRSVRYGEVARVIDQIKGAGANPVGLQIDDLER
jgi:biopolymer transport protein ExbD